MRKRKIKRRRKRGSWRNRRRKRRKRKRKRRKRKWRRKGKDKKTSSLNEIQATLVDHVFVNGMTMRKAGLQVRPDLSASPSPPSSEPSGRCVGKENSITE